MTGNVPARTLLTRRRVIAGAVALVLILAVAGLGFGMFDQNNDVGVKMECVGFDKSQDGQSIVAVIKLSNHSDKWLLFMGDSDRKEVWCSFVSSGPSGPSGWWPPMNEQSLGRFSLVAHSEETRKALLPEDGRRGRLKVYYTVPPQGFGFRARVQALARRLMPFRKGAVLIIGDQEIQCPRRLRDGTVEPPRLLSRPGAKP